MGQRRVNSVLLTSSEVAATCYPAAAMPSARTDADERAARIGVLLDGLHLTATGARIYARFIARALRFARRGPITPSVRIARTTTLAARAAPAFSAARNRHERAYAIQVSASAMAALPRLRIAEDHLSRRGCAR